CKRQNTACAPRWTIRDEPDEHLLPAIHAAESIFELSVLVHSASVRAARMGLLAARRRRRSARAGPGVRQPRAPATHQLARHQDRVRELEPDGSLAPPVAWHLGCTTRSRTLEEARTHAHHPFRLRLSPAARRLLPRAAPSGSCSGEDRRCRAAASAGAQAG